MAKQVAWPSFFRKGVELEVVFSNKVACVSINPRREGVRGFGTCMWSCQSYYRI